VGLTDVGTTMPRTIAPAPVAGVSPGTTYQKSGDGAATRFGGSARRAVATINNANEIARKRFMAELLLQGSWDHLRTHED
jgi:hypothetical protein